jgi:transcriptional regulator with XRE-family HTH domain
MSIADRLTAHRRAEGVTAYVIADRLGVHYTTYYRWEAGAIPQISHLPGIARHLGCSVADLCGVGEDSGGPLGAGEPVA